MLINAAAQSPSITIALKIHHCSKGSMFFIYLFLILFVVLFVCLSVKFLFCNVSRTLSLQLKRASRPRRDIELGCLTIRVPFGKYSCFCNVSRTLSLQLKRASRPRRDIAEGCLIYLGYLSVWLRIKEYFLRSTVCYCYFNRQSVRLSQQPRSTQIRR